MNNEQVKAIIGAIKRYEQINILWGATEGFQGRIKLFRLAIYFSHLAR